MNKPITDRQLIQVVRLLLVTVLSVILIKRVLNSGFLQLNSNPPVDDGRIFENFEFDPQDRFNIHDNIKYSWIITITLATVLSFLLV